ncbi:hypothetical protein HY478_00275 [Candidatus Uhrbacteria bacterium]|nr:hypothetical protein [Candidatus Uhrbacteria bacterium]
MGMGVASFKELQTRFENLAEEKGAVYAFEILKRASLPPNTDLHLLGHTVGDMLYKQKGIDGIADCTQDFRNACSHTIVIGTLNEFGGEQALEMIREACRKAPGGSGAYTMCYHGLGHGIFTFYEYSLPETVALCEKTGTREYRERETVECIGGSVMELTGGGGHDPELWQKAREKYLVDPLSPCMSNLIPDNAKAQCLTYLTPELWKHVGINMGHPEPELFTAAFSYCDSIAQSREDLRSACFGGFGKEFVPLALGRDIRDTDAWSARETSLVEDWCSRADDREGKAACIEQALQSLFWGGENDPAIAFRFCGNLLQSGLKQTCEEELGRAISAYVRGETRTSLCMQLPPEAQETCSG